MTKTRYDNRTMKRERHINEARQKIDNMLAQSCEQNKTGIKQTDFYFQGGEKWAHSHI